MTSRTANKIKERREKLKENQTPVVVPEPNKQRFWILAAVSVFIIIFLSFLASTSNLSSELIIPIIVAVIVLLLLIIWYLPKFYLSSLPIETGKDFDREKERLKLEDDTRKTFAQIIGGIVFIGGLIFTYNTFRLQQEGQFTDRFTKAVTQLGDDKLEIRLGGLYALERIAKDSPKDHWTVMEILSAYIRENAKKKEEIVENNSNKIVNDEVKVTTDIQAALTIIGRRNISQDSKTDEIDLTETNLAGANLVGANMTNVNLYNTDLRNAYLVRANLREANLNFANLGFALLDDADLRGARLIHAKNLEINFIRSAIINEQTILPDYLKDRKSELIENR